MSLWNRKARPTLWQSSLPPIMAYGEETSVAGHWKAWWNLKIRADWLFLCITNKMPTGKKKWLSSFFFFFFHLDHRLNSLSVLLYFIFLKNLGLVLRVWKFRNLKGYFSALNTPKEKPERQPNVSAKQFKLSSFSLYRQQLHFEGKCFTIVITHNRRNVFFPFILLPWWVNLIFKYKRHNWF